MKFKTLIRKCSAIALGGILAASSTLVYADNEPAVRDVSEDAGAIVSDVEAIADGETVVTDAGALSGIPVADILTKATDLPDDFYAVIQNHASADDYMDRMSLCRAGTAAAFWIDHTAEGVCSLMHFIENGDGSYSIRPMDDESICLDVDGEYTSAGAGLVFASYTDAADQKWDIYEEDGLYYLSPQNAPEACLSFAGVTGENGSAAKVDAFSRNGGEGFDLLIFEERTDLPEDELVRIKSSVTGTYMTSLDWGEQDTWGADPDVVFCSANNTFQQCWVLSYDPRSEGYSIIPADCGDLFIYTKEGDGKDRYSTWIWDFVNDDESGDGYCYKAYSWNDQYFLKPVASKYSFLECADLSSVENTPCIRQIFHTGQGFEIESNLAVNNMTGQCGLDISYRLEGDGPSYKLILSGEDYMSEWGKNLPWRMYPLSEIVIGDGILNLNNFHRMEIASITIPTSVESIETSAFLYSTVADVYYEGTEEEWDEIEIGGHNEALTSARMHFKGDEPQPVVMIEQPKSVSAKIGDKITFHVDAENVEEYQWFFRKEGGKTWYKSGMTGAATDTLSFKLAESNVGRDYKCRMTDATGKYVYTSVVTVDVFKPVEILSQPETVSAGMRDKVSFQVSATGVEEYQWFFRKEGGKTWYKSGMTGAATDTLSFTLSESNAGRDYKCRMMDSKGNYIYSKIVTVNVVEGIRILSQPQSVTATIGASVSFAVSALGAESYQWYYSKDNGKNWYKSSVTGAATDTMTFKLSSSNAGRSFKCKMVDGRGKVVYSDVVTVNSK